MPKGPGTYGSKVGRPKKKKTLKKPLTRAAVKGKKFMKSALKKKAGKGVKGVKPKRTKSTLTAKQKRLPPALQKKIVAAKKKAGKGIKKAKK